VRWRQVTLVFLLLLGGATGVYWWWQQWLEGSQDAPIRAAARRYGLPAPLVKAVVWRESRFHPRTRGRAQELGLMQLRETAAQEWAEAEGLAGFEHEHCLDSRTNTLAGAWYLSKLLRRYSRTDDPLPYALADYNAGRGNVLKWNYGGGATNSAAFIEQIRFPTTRAYVKAVIARYQAYRTRFK